MSVGFKPVQVRRGSRGETEIVEGSLKEVSLLPLGAYDGARVLAMREAAMMITPTIPLDEIDFSPTVPGWVY
jgi:phage head maturation protease